MPFMYPASSRILLSEDTHRHQHGGETLRMVLHEGGRRLRSKSKDAQMSCVELYANTLKLCLRIHQHTQRRRSVRPSEFLGSREGMRPWSAPPGARLSSVPQISLHQPGHLTLNHQLLLAGAQACAHHPHLRPTYYRVHLTQVVLVLADRHSSVRAVTSVRLWSAYG